MISLERAARTLPAQRSREVLKRRALDLARRLEVEGQVVWIYFLFLITSNKS